MVSAEKSNLTQKWYNVIHAIPATEIVTKSVEAIIGAKYIGDFTGLLLSLKVPSKYHYPIVLLNNMNSPTDYDGRTSINMVKEELFSKLYKIIR